MAQEQSAEALRRPQKTLWVLFPLIAAASLVLGYLGLQEFLSGNEDYGHRALDLVYYDVQLFVLGSDPLQQTTGPLPWPLEVARFTAPSVTVYAVFEAIRRMLSVEVSRRRARRSSGHALVCGDSPFADALTRRLQEEGLDVVEVRLEVDTSVSAGEPLRVLGDPRDPEVLHAAGVRHAAVVYACAEESSTNISIGLAVRHAVGASRRDLAVHSLVADPDFCATVQAYFLGRPTDSPVRLDFFTVASIAARRILATALPEDGRPPARILVAGDDALARAVVLEAVGAHRQRGRDRDGRRRPLELTLVGPAASAALARMAAQYPFLTRESRLVPVDDYLLPLIRRGELTEPFDQVVIAYADEERALKTALAAERHWRGGSGPIALRLEGATIGRNDVSLLDASPGAISVFGAVSLSADPQLIRDDLTERLARVLHDRYVSGRRSRGEAISGAMVPWDDLPERLRRANREQAEDIGRKLARIGYVITSRHATEQEAELAADEIDQLARMEHDRWCRSQQELGWQWAPEHDVERKTHPGLVTWADLPEQLRLRNYDPVRELPMILGDAGFQIVRAGRG